MRLAIIDLGSNSVRFDVYEIDKQLNPTRIHREKQMIRLGDGMFKAGSLNEEAMERAVTAFDGFREQLEEFGVQRVVTFATAALRGAKDSRRLIDRIRRRTSISIKVISGEEEAKLIAKGIVNNEFVPSGLYALVDIGGGSTEISICHKRKVIDSHSFDLGANRLQQIYLKTSPPVANGDGVDPVEKLRRKVKKEVSSVIKSNRWPQVKTVVGSSGTIKAFRRILRRAGRHTEPFRRADLKPMLDEMAEMDAKQIRKVPGMEPKRVDLILAGGVLLDEVLEALGSKHVFVTEFSLRDGVLEQEMSELTLKLHCGEVEQNWK